MLKKNPFSFFSILIFSSLVYSSCSTSKMTLSILEPGTYILPRNLQRISIFSKPAIQEKPFHFDSLTNFFYPLNASAIQLKSGIIDGLFSVIETSPRFTRVKLSDSTFNGLLNYGNLRWEDVDKICLHDTSDALLILTHAVTYDSRELSMLATNTRWVFCKPKSHYQFNWMYYADTVSFSPDLLINPEDLLYQNCFVIGQSFGQRLCPHWIDADRIIFMGPGKDLKNAWNFTLSDKWYVSGKIWDELSQSSSQKKASRAAFNIAVAFERDDDLNQAYLWIKFADSLQSNRFTSAYKKILENRIAIQPKLDEQMAGN